MGCSFDRIGVTIDKKENIKTFVDIFNEELKDALYWPEDQFIHEDIFEEDELGNYYADIEDEPLFNMMENGAQLVNVVHKYLETVPDCKFSLWYECTFNNCGAIVYTTYEYSDYTLEVVDKDSEGPDLSYCPECEWDAYDDDCEDDALCTIDTWEPDKEYKCPQCGAVLDWEVFVNKRMFRMVDGRLVDNSKNDP